MKTLQTKKEITKDFILSKITQLMSLNYKMLFLKFWHKLQIHDRRILITCHDLFFTILACRLALFFTLEGSDTLLASGFFLKQYSVVGFIAVSFFLWFQTYKGVWRFFSFRQAILLCVVTSLTTLIYAPLLLKASLSPVEIPVSTVGMFWLLQTGTLIGSRLISRAIRFHQIMREAVAQLPVNPNHVILIGQKSAIKTFKKRFSLLKKSPLDVLGVIVTDYKSDKDLDEAETQIESFNVLGHMGDMRSLYDEFVSDDIAPHQIIFLDNSVSTKEQQTLLTSFEQTSIQFGKMADDLPLHIRPLELFDIYESDLSELMSLPFEQKSVLIVGAANPVGEALVKELLKLKISHINLWDSDVFGLESLKSNLLFPHHPKSHSKSVADMLSFSSISLDKEDHLIDFLRQRAPDVVINLRSFLASVAGNFDPLKPYEIYLRENTDFVTSALKTNVKKYVFVTSDVPHQRDSNRLSALMSTYLKSIVHSFFTCEEYPHAKDNDSQANFLMDQANKTYYAINIPMVLSKKTTQFLSSEKVVVSQEDVSVCSPKCAAHMILQSLINMEVSDKNSKSDVNFDDQILSEPNYNFDIVTYEFLSSQYKLISKSTITPKIIHKLETPMFDWPHDEERQRKIFSYLHCRDLDGLKSALKSTA